MKECGKEPRLITVPEPLFYAAIRESNSMRYAVQPEFSLGYEELCDTENAVNQVSPYKFIFLGIEVRPE